MKIQPSRTRVAVGADPQGDDKQSANIELVRVARDYWTRRGQVDYNADGLESYVWLKLMDGDLTEASRAMARHGPYRADVYGVFMHVGLLTINARFGRRLDAAARTRLRQTVRHVLHPANRVYTWDFHFLNDNWPFCAAAIQILGGELLRDTASIEAGLDKLRHYSRIMGGLNAAGIPCGVSSEHNSPNYVAEQVQPLAALTACAGMAEARVRGQLWQEATLMDLATHWHPALQQQVGPYSRAYQDNLYGGSGRTRLLAHKLWGPVFMAPEVSWDVGLSEVLAMAADIAATGYACPGYITALATDKTYPHEVKARCAFFCQDAPYHVYPESMDPSPVEIHSYLERDWMIGSASRTYHAQIGQAASPLLHWLRRRPVSSMRDYGVMYFRYVFDEKLPNQPNYDHVLGDVRPAGHFRDDGIFRDFQDRHTVLHLAGPQWGSRDASSLSLIACVPMYAEVDEVWLGSRLVRAFPAETVGPSTVFIRDGRMAIGIRPLTVTDCGRRVATQVRMANNHLLISWHNYGPAARRRFSYDELIAMQNGLAIQGATCRTTGEFRRFRRRLETATVRDVVEDDRRKVFFDDGQSRLEGVVHLSRGHWEQRQVGGEPYRPEIFQAPGVVQSFGRCQCGATELDGPEHMALRLVAQESLGLYAVYNFGDEPADFRLRTPHGKAIGRLSFGKVVFRKTARGLALAARVSFGSRWRAV